MTIGDTEGCVSGATVLELGDKVNALHDSEHHEMISATVLTSTYVAGTYRDKVSFVLYYDGTPK